MKACEKFLQFSDQDVNYLPKLDINSSLFKEQDDTMNQNINKLFNDIPVKKK